MIRFANPGALVFGTLVAVLIALYLWERRRRRIDVPSLLLWKTVPDALVRTTRFRPDILFFLQLSILTLLILGLAGPHVSGSNERPHLRHIFIIDASASMQAREDRSTRFDEARGALRERLRTLPDVDEAMLIVATHQAEVLSPFTRDHDDLLHRLDVLRAADTSTDLKPAMAIARRASAGSTTSVEVFTDLPSSFLSSDWDLRLIVHQVGLTDENVAIEGLQILQSRFQDHGDARGRVLVRNFSHREAHGFLTVRVEGDVLSRRGFSLRPREARSFPITGFPRPGIVHVQLEVEDALDSDNHAWAWIRPSRPVRALTISENAKLRAQLERVAAATPHLELDFLRSSAWSPSRFPAADVLILDRIVVRAPTNVPVLYLFPSASSQAFSIEGEVNHVSLGDWNETHPALRELRPQLSFPLQRTRVLDLSKSLDVLLTGVHQGREIPLAFAGEHRGTRVAGLAFDLAREQLLEADNVNLLLIFLSLLEWLVPADPAATVLRTGSLHLVEDLPLRSRRVSSPDGHVRRIAAHQPVIVETPLVGRYSISTHGTERLVLANLFDPVESDIGRKRPGMRFQSDNQTPEATTPSLGTDLAPWLYVFAITLLLGEWWVAERSE